MKISVDGALVKTITANAPDQGSANPGFAKAAGVTPAGHSFDLTVPASATARQLCVTAVNVGGGTDTTMCRSVDRVVEFDGNAISYDLDHLQITNATLDELDRVDQRNSTSVQQSTTISGTKSVADTQGWSNTYGLKVTMSGGVSIPLISDFKVSVEGSAQWVQNGSETNTSTFTWSQPVLVPAKSEVVATVAVTKTTLTVPYTLSGTYLYASGTRVAGTNSGTFTGVNSHDLQVTLQQFNLDGTPALRAAKQPKPTVLRQLSCPESQIRGQPAAPARACRPPAGTHVQPVCERPAVYRQARPDGRRRAPEFTTRATSAPRSGGAAASALTAASPPASCAAGRHSRPAARRARAACPGAR